MSSSSSFAEFCGSDLWNSNLTWNTANKTPPDITPCMEHVGIVWVPCGFLWVGLIPYLMYLSTMSSLRIPQNLTAMSAIKSVLPLLVSVLYVYNLATSTLSAVDLVTTAIAALTMIMSSALVQIYRKKGQYTSALLWFFWFFAMTANLIEVYIRIKRFYWHGAHNDRTGMIVTCVQAGLYILGFILSSFSDAGTEAINRYKDRSPEILVSFPCFITFQWMQPIMTKGYRKHKNGEGLLVEDLYKLTPEDTADEYFPPFEKNLDIGLKDFMESEKSSDMEETASTSSYETDESTPLLSSTNSTSVTIKKKKKDNFSLVRPLLKQFLPLLLAGWTVRAIAEAMQFINPIAQGLLISFVASQVSDNPEPLWRGLLYCIGLALGNITLPLTWGLQAWCERRVYLQMRSCLCIAIYKKSLKMSGQAKQNSDTGELVNHMSLDAQRVAQLVNEASTYIYITVQVSIGLYLLYGLVGSSMFAGLTVLIVSGPVTVIMCKFAHKFRDTCMKTKDKRIKIINETLSAIKVIKLYAWELPFIQKISNLRDIELKLLRTLNILNAGFISLFIAIPIFATLITFAIYTANQPEHFLAPSVAFVSLTLFDRLRGGLNHLPHSIVYVVECLVSVKRLTKYFKSEEIDGDNVIHDPNAEFSLQISGGIFSHLREKKPVLKDINMRVKPGSLTALVGSVGCGKSSLLSALIGDLYKQSGTVTVKGSTALVAQQAFILNATVRDNILFGCKYDKKKYEAIVEACALTRDFQILTKGDKSQIGEKGINLSGGQKQRISLARAVYVNADIYLLDDPLSAVDAHVGKHIFDHVIGPDGLLKDKARFMVTHGIHWLPMVDEVYVMKSGKLAEHGSYEALLDHNGEFAEFVREFFLSENKSATKSEEEKNPAELQKQILSRLESITSVTSNEDMLDALALESEQAAHDGGKTLSPRSPRLPKEKVAEGTNEEEEDDTHVTTNVFDTEEDVETRKVSWRTFMMYFRAQGFVLTLIFITMGLMSKALTLGNSFWISAWTSDVNLLPTSNASSIIKQKTSQMYLEGLAGFGLSSILASLMGLIAGVFAFYMASKKLHKLLLQRVLKAKMTIFDSKPLGMILNRFSNDIEVIDNRMGWVLRRSFNMTFSIVCTFGSIIYLTPYMAIPIVTLVGFYFALQRYFIPTARQTRRQESKLCSPIYSHFTETLNGAQTIRAYKQQDRFIRQNTTTIETYNTVAYYERFQNSWLQVRMFVLHTTLIVAASLFCVLSTQIESLSGLITASTTGLILSLVFNICGELEGMVWLFAQLETDAVSVERLKEYTELEQEADWTSDIAPPREWPQNGRVVCNHYATRYKPDLDLVVKDFDVEIKPQEKIGIVGRTGAGKSSLTLSLFRMLEAAGGNIIIDGVNIANIGLHELRNSITILPQDPILFSGSIRENLDPFSKRSDEKLWEVLEQSQLKEFVKEQPGELSADCGEGGENLSVGQRQLICLARALLRKTKILVLDEATAAVDLKTDDFIQKTIRREFSTCTILTIAHRLNTIIDYDRILVMDQGCVVEFDSPANLLKDRDGVFHSMAQHAGLI